MRFALQLLDIEFIMNQNILQQIKATMMCEELTIGLAISEESLCIIDEERDNCGAMSPSAQVDDIQKANKKDGDLPFTW